MNSKIYIKDLRMHAFHGVLPQEREVGNDYIINVSVAYPFITASLSDNVSDTMNYAEAADVIKREMLVQSNLLENVAYRIAKALLSAFPLATSVEIDLQKIAPPMSFDCAGAGVSLTMDR